MRVLVAAVLLTSCGPSAREVCQRSLDNRANGLYANLSKEHEEAAYLDFASGCLESCIGEIEAVQGTDKPLSLATESAVCLEADYLVAGGDPRGMPDMVERCAGGNAEVCKWVEDHQRIHHANFSFQLVLDWAIRPVDPKDPDTLTVFRTSPLDPEGPFMFAKRRRGEGDLGDFATCKALAESEADDLPILSIDIIPGFFGADTCSFRLDQTGDRELYVIYMQPPSGQGWSLVCSRIPDEAAAVGACNTAMSTWRFE